jgi:hypothetical protein
VVGCGDNAEPRSRLEVVGHTDLGARGMNAAIAIAGDYAYVGSRIDNKPVLIVDIKDPFKPQVVGEIGPPAEGLTGMSSRELRATTNPPMLFVLNLQCSTTLHGCQPGAGEIENIKQYDISNPTAPTLVGTHPVQGRALAPRSPHEFFLWQDPVDRRVLLMISAPGAPDDQCARCALARDRRRRCGRSDAAGVVRPLYEWRVARRHGQPVALGLGER